MDSEGLRRIRRAIGDIPVKTAGEVRVRASALAILFNEEARVQQDRMCECGHALSEHDRSGCVTCDAAWIENGDKRCARVFIPEIETTSTTDS